MIKFPIQPPFFKKFVIIMFKINITPNIEEINALRQVRNTTIPIWFETARIDLIKIFNPECDLSYKKWNLLLVNMDFNFLKPVLYGYEVEIRTYLLNVGKTSFTTIQEVWQNGILKVNGRSTLIYYDFIREKSCVIPEEIRVILKEHIITKEDLDNKNKKEIKN